ncbi:glutathione peroxidase subfamily protein [Teredinibacter turnerae T7901]|uniref:Glutathione peroxidase n=1 Tax=Teredinibacter turnerae (strain ATCC 39867 / T7901) TaxID=377629 RepID=C5BMV9_TERTT|nr:glutathione peroxidase [Teredinibacter turnerae]ACR12211.1 glutathione peroxidase subfamily protein [Teredinibacter turnerae T7901]
MSAVQNIPVNRIDGEQQTLADYQGKVLLVVNVASKCGLTPQYEGLQKLYADKQGDGLEILGFPANNFMGQEPGSNEEIQEFCSLNFNVSFPMFEKISVLGDDKHPLYDALTDAQPSAEGDGPFREKLKGHGVERDNPADILWNFEKFVVGRSGEVVARFAPDVTADDPRLVACIEAELAKS